MAQARKLHDQFFLQAKEDGYAARSAYKLKEIVEKKRIIRRGDRVIDLGCAPGSWVQVASELVGPGGRVGGIDLNAQQVTHCIGVFLAIQAVQPDVAWVGVLGTHCVETPFEPRDERRARGLVRHLLPAWWHLLAAQFAHHFLKHLGVLRNVAFSCMDAV